MNARDLYRSGRIAEALEAQLAEVRSKPADVDERSFLAELMCTLGELERADTQLQTIAGQVPEHAVGVALVRQLVRAALAREEFYREGRPPELLKDPDESLSSRLRASICLREGDGEGAVRELAAAEESRKPAALLVNGNRVDDVRDLDDLLGGVLELFTSTGKYYWVPMAEVRELSMHAPERPLDVIWRRASLDVADGPEGDVYIPTVYAPAPDDASDAQRTGRETDWRESVPGVVRGVGQRMFLAGEEALAISQIERLEAPGE